MEENSAEDMPHTILAYANELERTWRGWHDPHIPTFANVIGYDFLSIALLAISMSEEEIAIWFDLNDFKFIYDLNFVESCRKCALDVICNAVQYIDSENANHTYVEPLNKLVAALKITQSSSK